MNHVTHLTALTVAVSLLTSHVHAAGTDPMDWSAPAAVPEFRDTLDETTYQQRSQELLKAVDAAALEKPGLPPMGARTLEVEHDSPAEKEGLEPGDVITHCNGRVVWADDAVVRTDGQDELVWVSPDGKEHRASFASGKIGATWTLHRDASRLYRLRGQRNVKWDAHVLTALVAAGNDNELAEAAWSRAIAAGYKPDYLSSSFGADIAFAANRSEEAIAFAWFALEGDAKAGQFIRPDVIYRVLIANYKLEQALKLWDAYSISKDVPDALRKLISLHRGRTAEQRQAPPPSQLAADRIRVDALREGRDYDRTGGLQGDPASPGFKVELRSPARFKTDIYANAYPSRDMDVMLRFTFTPDSIENKFRSGVTVGISDLRWKEQWQSDHDYRRMVGSVEISPGYTIFTFGNANGTDVPLPEPGIGTGWKHRHEVRAVRVGGQIEVFHNKRRVMWLPVDDRAEASGFFMKMVNARATVLDIRAEELLELR